MRTKNCFHKQPTLLLLMLTLLGLAPSCKDEYRLDDEKPSWIQRSVYSRLQKDGKFSNYLRLLADPDVNPIKARPLTDVLDRTGSKTVFAAEDEAWEKFFAENALRPESDPWHTATSYENLSASQKKLLIHTSMLNNAFVLETLSSGESQGSNPPTRGEYLRRFTDVELTDSITYIDGNSLPTNYNLNNKEKDYWQRFRSENGGNGIYLVNDASRSMMVHFTNEQLKKADITDNDFSIFMRKTRNTEDVHIYDAKVVKKDAVCENGYVNTTERVFAPLPNLAEMIRTNGQTNIFSHMLDRWSAPYYNHSVTEAYKTLMKSKGLDWQDSIFSKRYFSDISLGHEALKNDPEGQPFRDASSTDVGLKFDPGWNEYYDEYRRPEFDMASMFVPNDETMWRYFTEGGGGWQLIQTYTLKVGTKDEIPYVAPTTNEELYQQIDQIPISTLRSLINIIMFKSFISSVPSKMTRLRDDAQEQIFLDDDTIHIVDSRLANNGILYITDKVYGPADYTSVAAPAYISNTNLVMRWAIYNGSTSAKDYMGLNYYAYLKAMQSDFIFFLPSDKGLSYYYDPVSFVSDKPRVINLKYQSASFPISSTMYHYDKDTGEIGTSDDYRRETIDEGEVTNRLKDILESHTIVLEGRKEIDSDVDEYYLTKNYSPVKVTRQNGKVVKVQGGFQLENEAAGIQGIVKSEIQDEYPEAKGVQAVNVEDEHSMNNGTTYILDAPIIPASRTVYGVLTNDGSKDYEKFYDLCENSESEKLIVKSGLVRESLAEKTKATELKKYRIFTDIKGPSYGVQFFNNYMYTVFVPTNEAIDQAVQNGLPTWESIDEDFNASIDEDGRLRTEEDSLRIQAKITYLVNFLRYHFADNSVFVDQSTFDSREYVTASFDNAKEIFCKLNMRRPQAGVLQVKDMTTDGAWLTIGGKYNIMARDVACSKSPIARKSMNGVTIDGSSFAVIHQIPGVLCHTELVNGRHDGAWETGEKAKRYLKAFKL